MNKHNIFTTIAWALLIMVTACEENDVMPSYEKVGESTSTVASLAASKAKPAASETITLTLKFVNISSDPVKTVTLKAKVGTGDYAEVQTFDETSSGTGVEITHEVAYVVPDAAGTKVTFDMVISSQKEFPQIKRTDVTVQ